MMSGRLYIDGKDAYMHYGVYVVQGGWNELIAYPPLKPVNSNDWQEEDGIEVDLSSPALNSREVSLNIAINGPYSRFNALIELLSDGAYHTFECAHIQRRYKLRLLSIPNLDTTEVLDTATLKFADDFPLLCYKYAAPISHAVASDSYTFDDIPFSRYGVRVLEGTLDEIRRMPNVKTNLLRNINTESGALYDGKNVTYKSKDVKIYCLLRAATLNELWRNYDALLYDLTRPEERLLKTGKSKFPFYYKDCQVTEFYPEGKIWLRFVMTVVFTRDLRNCLYSNSMRFVDVKDIIRLTAEGNFRFND